MAAFTLVIGNKNYSSWSLRAWLMLKQAGIEFDEVRIPLNTPDTHDQILKYSPSGRVPTLIHGDLTIWESLAIGEYIAEQVPNRHLWPQDSSARAIARSVSSEMHAGFRDLRQHMPMDCRSRYPGEGMTPGVQEDIQRMTDLWHNCRDRFGGGGAFLFGAVTLADAMFAPVVSRFVTYGVTLDAIAQAYADAIWEYPAMQEWLAAASAEVEVIDDHTL